MKETKMYVDELPKDCIDCPCRDAEYNECNLLNERHCIGHLDDEMVWKDVPVTTDFKEISCPLIDIKTHDRELVRQVCEKIARNVRVRKIQEEWYVFETDLRAVLNQIQKEYEK